MPLSVNESITGKTIFFDIFTPGSFKTDPVLILTRSPVIRFISLTLRIIFFGAFSILLFPYIISKHYHYPEPALFSGPRIYNPYADTTGKWLKANFHAHTRAWGGLTNGKQTDTEIVKFYHDSLHYEIACISNYESIDPYLPAGDPRFIPVYEHGLNPFKTHQLVIGAAKPDYFEMAMGQSQDNKQYMIDRLRRQAPFVTINHPTMRGSYTASELRHLSGYQLMEVFNNPRDAQSLWDAALSAGQLSWALGNDDTHDITKAYEVGRTWTMISATSDAAVSVYDALHKGNMYVVKGEGAVNELHPSEITVRQDTICIRTDVPADEIRLIGQEGQTRKTVNHSDSICYVFQPGDTYIRAVLSSHHTTICLNPFLRYDGKNIPVNEFRALYAPFKTILYRILFIAIWLLAGAWLFGKLQLFRRK